MVRRIRFRLQRVRTSECINNIVGMPSLGAQVSSQVDSKVWEYNHAHNSRHLIYILSRVSSTAYIHDSSSTTVHSYPRSDVIKTLMESFVPTQKDPNSIAPVTKEKEKDIPQRKGTMKTIQPNKFYKPSHPITNSPFWLLLE